MRQRSYQLVLLSGILVLLNACALHKPHYGKKMQDWEAQMPDPDSDVEHTVYLAGDAGNGETATQSEGLKLLEHHLMKEKEKSSVVFLGNNFSRKMLRQRKNERVLADNREHIRSRLSYLNDFNGRSIFIPGNNEWESEKQGSLEALQQHEALLESLADSADIFLPSGGCPGPVEIKLAKDVRLIVVDSQWWMHEWHNPENLNNGCEIQDPVDYMVQFEDAVRRNKNKHVIIATHHPILSNGEHGGSFSLRSHIFPLTHLNKNLYIPLPVVGSLYALFRSSVGTPQDMANGQYAQFRRQMLAATAMYPDVVFASAHDHSLQFFADEADRNFIVSGGVGQPGFVRKGGKADFAQSSPGFSKLVYYTNGEAWVEFWVPDGQNPDGRLAFRKKIQKGLPTVEESSGLVGDETLPDSISVVPSTRYKAGKFKRFLWGDANRFAWETEVTVPVLDLSKVNGGLTVTSKGGRYQTISYRLEDKEGRQYVLRSVEKDISPIVPEFMENTIAQDMMQDQMASSHAYGAFAVPDLAAGAGIYHTRPRLYYVPQQHGLGAYQDGFEPQLFLLEERPSGDWSDEARYGNSEDIIGYGDLLKKMRKSHKHRVDQRWVLRSRLFDMLMGDYDRHDDQWRWASFKKDGHKRYRPIPRDRDMVFFMYNGVLPWITSRKIFIRYLQGFERSLRDVVGLNSQARWFDRAFLSEMELEEWLAEVEHIREGITDSIIEHTMDDWPKEIKAKEAAMFKERLRSRLDELDLYARKYYRFLAKTVDVVGTDDRELFEIDHLNKDSTRVRMYALSKSGKKQDLLYERVFKGKETKAIHIYALGGDDRFVITGKASRAIKIRIIGGSGNDDVQDGSKVGGVAKRTLYYDWKKEENTFSGTEVRNMLSRNPEVNAYNRLSFEYDTYLPLVLAGYNEDEGFYVGAGGMATIHGFRKRPYASKHFLLARYSISTEGVNINYKGDYPGVFRTSGLALETSFFTPKGAFNFYGFGNESIRLQDSRTFYRVKLRQLKIDPTWKMTFNEHVHTIQVGPKYEFTKPILTTGRFAGDSLSGLLPFDFSSKHYLGLKARYTLNNVDNAFFPTRGTLFETEASWNARLNQSFSQYGQVKSQLAVYFSIEVPMLITYAMRVGGAYNFGSYEFYQGNTLGRETNLRGWRTDRFTGDVSFYQNNDLRIQFLHVKNRILPFKAGILGGFDHGRVWVSNENSGRWHYSYSGGIFISPYSQAVISITYSGSVENDFVEAKLGFFF